MTKSLATLALIALMLSGCAVQPVVYDSQSSYYVYPAPVVVYQPVYRPYYQPRIRCWRCY